MLTVKSLAGAKLKALDAAGKGLAVIATLDEIDKDGDVILTGAFGEQTVKVVPAHDWMHVPLGKAVIRESGNEAVAEFALNLDIQAAKDWHSSLKQDLADPPSIQEWSFGFTVKDQEMGQFDGQDVRFLKELDVHEISPVMLGAGVNTRTLAIKSGEDRPSMKLADQIADVLLEVKVVIDRCEAIQEVRAKDGRDLSPDRYDDLAAMQKALGDLDRVQTALTEAIKNGGPIARVDFVDGSRLLSQHVATLHRLKGNKHGTWITYSLCSHNRHSKRFVWNRYK